MRPVMKKVASTYQAVVLLTPLFLLPITSVFAETVPEKAMEEQPTIASPTSEYFTQEAKQPPRFFFQQSRMTGVVNEALSVTISSDQEVEEVRIKLPDEAQIQTDGLPADMTATKDSESQEWLLSVSRAQNTFVISLVFESEGNYEISADDTTIVIEISEEKVITEDEMLADFPSGAPSLTPEDEPSESSLDNDEEDSQDTISDEMNTNEEDTDIRSSVNVSTWAQYAAAINNQSVTVINVTANISGNTTLNTINRNLTINGNGFTINSQEQNYRITGTNRQITVRNATIRGALLGASTQFLASSGASNTRFTFSDIIFRGANRFLGTSSESYNVIQTVIFDGGRSYFPNMNVTDSLLVNAINIQVVNQASVEVEGRRFSNNTTGTSAEFTNNSILFVQAGSSMSIADSTSSGIVANTINVDGILNISTTGRPIANSSRATLPVKINFGKNSKVTLERTGGNGGVVDNPTGTELFIAEGAEFDFIHKNSGPLIRSVPNPSFINIESDRLALWDLGLQNEEKASMIFSNIDLQLAGINGSEITSTNNERFQRLYDSAGLSSYSRMSNQNRAEMDRFVTVHYHSEDGATLEESETLTGFLGESYQGIKKDIPGYHLAVIPENASGEFTREMIEVTYVYQQSSFSPVDPLDPEIEVDPENKPELPEDQGQLSIDFISSFNFGSQIISARDQTYYAQPQRLLNEDGTINETEERPNYVQISDRRPEGARNGWQLAVRQNGQFETISGEALQGASIGLTNQQLATAQGGAEPSLQQNNPLSLVPNNRRVLVMAQGDEGIGTWIYRFGDANTAGESVSLTVPQGANPSATTYRTTLTWELAAVPENE